ncbi:hypothetical protein D3C74_356030 [compost metagenome]
MLKKLHRIPSALQRVSDIPLQTCIIPFPHVNLRHPDSTVCSLPLRACKKTFLPAVFIPQVQFQQQGSHRTVDLFIFFISQIALIPPISKQRTQRIHTFMQLTSNVIGLVLQPLAITGPARREIMLTHPAAVQLQFI